MWNLENYTNESVYKTETDSQIQKTNMLVKGESGGSDKSEVWVNRHKLLHINRQTRICYIAQGTRYSISCNNLQKSNLKNIDICI